jgi:hypothetical protein
MTTNVFDSNAGVLASDSRWSGQIDEYLFFVDDVGYDKIIFDSKLALLFAGNLAVIEVWKKWFRAGRYGHIPATHPDLSLCIVDLESGAIRKDHGGKLESNCGTARFAGTGSPHAHQCWATNKDAVRSVGTACGLDLMSGGAVTYLDRTSRENNINKVGSVETVMNAFLPKGEVIMLKANQKSAPVPIIEAIKEPAANDAFQKMITGGPAGVCAPFIGIGTEWTDAEIADLHAILSEYPPEPMEA